MLEEKCETQSQLHQGMGTLAVLKNHRKHLDQRMVLGVLAVLLALMGSPAARAQTSQQISAATQSGINYLLPDTVNWIKAQNCTACHRSGISLFALANSIHNGYTVALDHTTGLGWLADRIIQDQQSNGQWSYDGQNGTRTAQTAHEIFGIGSYTTFSGDTSRISNLTKAALFMSTVTNTQDYQTVTFPNDGKLNAGVQVKFWSDCAYQDFPIVYSSIAVTAKVLYGLNATLNDDPTLSAGDKLTIQNALQGGTQWLEGYLDRHSLSVSTSGYQGSGCNTLNGLAYNFEAGYALIGLAAGGKNLHEQHRRTKPRYATPRHSCEWLGLG